MDRKRKRRLAQMRLTIGIILALALAVGIVLVGFRTRNISVVGNSRHSADEIRGDLIYDFLTNNSLFFAWKYKTAMQEERAPYLSSVQAKLTGPGSVQITVGEKKIVGGVVCKDEYIYFDDTGLILEKTSSPKDGIPVISGITMEDPQLYQKLPVANAALLRTMLNVSQLVVRSGLIADGIEFDENMNMTVSVGDISIELGQDEYLEEKVSNLATIYPQIAGHHGTLKMSSYTGRSEEIPFEEMAVENAAETEEENVSEISASGTDEDGTAQNEDDPQDDADDSDQDTDGEDEKKKEKKEETGEVVGVEGFMVFDSYGTLHYDARVIDGQVKDAYGNPIEGCSVNEDGYVVDGYWNVIDPMTGVLAGQ